MFYTYDLLTKDHPGVATVWLSATVGTTGGAAKRISRKAIESVEVSETVDKIMNPGPPMALRLQANLLYGLVRVYSKQCDYTLADAEKVQKHIWYLRRNANIDDTLRDPGMALRSAPLMKDDPLFDPDAPLPMLDLESVAGAEDLLAAIQGSNDGSFSYLMTVQQSNSSALGRGTSLPSTNLDLNQSDGLSLGFFPSFNDPAYSSSAKAQPNFDPFEDEAPPLGGFDIDFDASGNLIDPFESVPPLPLPRSDMAADKATEPEQLDALDMPTIMGIERNTYNIAGEAVLLHEPSVQDIYDPIQEMNEVAVAGPAANRPARARMPPGGIVDDKTKLRVSVLKDWEADYAERMAAGNAKKAQAKVKKRRAVAAAAAVETALGYVFRVGNVAQDIASGFPGFKSPLVDFFAGNALRENLALQPLAGEKARSGPRKYEEAFGEDRKKDKRARIENDGQQLGRQVDPDDVEAYELGRAASVGMSDHRSGSTLTWRLGSSQAPGSAFGSQLRTSQKGPGSRLAPSPLAGRGSIVLDLEASGDQYSIESMLGLDGPNIDSGAGLITQLDQDDCWPAKFLPWATETAMQAGTAHKEDSEKLSWVDFEHLMEPGVYDQEVAARAFFNILSLASSNKIKVKQEPSDSEFTRIDVGFRVKEALCDSDHGEAKKDAGVGDGEIGARDEDLDIGDGGENNDGRDPYKIGDPMEIISVSSDSDSTDE